MLHNDGRLLKLGSFGIAKQLDGYFFIGHKLQFEVLNLSCRPDGCLFGRIGTITHISPEMVDGKAITTKSDVWSFGVTAYELASLNLPVRSD